MVCHILIKAKRPDQHIAWHYHRVWISVGLNCVCAHGSVVDIACGGCMVVRRFKRASRTRDQCDDRLAGCRILFFPNAVYGWTNLQCRSNTDQVTLVPNLIKLESLLSALVLLVGTCTAPRTFSVCKLPLV